MLYVSVLGEQSITDDTTGAVVTRSPRGTTLVAFLALHAGVAQPRQLIAPLFWPDSTTAQALTNLRRELHHLRRALEDDPAVEVTSRDLCWRDTETSRVDLRTFTVEYQAARAAATSGDDEAALRHATTALAEYRGPLLPGMYDDWILEARSDLERHCVDLCDLLCRLRTRTGDLPGAIDTVRRRIPLRPLEESGYRTLMTLQAEHGDRAGAVSTYHRCAAVLERELGLAPDPATRTLADRLLAPADPTATARPIAGPAAERPGLAAPTLVGRTRELRRLHETWRTAAAGHPTLVLVTGGAGVGKTRLVAEIADSARAQPAAVVAGTQCFGTSGRLALAPVADWLRTPAVQPALTALDPIWRAEVDRLVPSGAARPEPGAGVRAMVDAWQRLRFFEGLARALIGGGRPVLLTLDSIQWCDPETLTFLTFCLSLTPDAPLMVAATARTDDTDENRDLEQWADRMRTAGLLADLPLQPLGACGTARLAETLGGRPLDPQDAELLHATTGGFPLYIIEAMRSGPGVAPAGRLADVLHDRIGQVSPAARDVAGLAAAVGRDFTLDLLTEASDLDTDAVVRAVDELWQRRILRQFRDGYDFSHDLLRDAAYARISPPRRWLLHRRLAQSLELLHADDYDSVSAQLAEQYARGGRPDRAVTYYRRAADVASSTFAHTEAIRLHKKALAIARTQLEGRDAAVQELAVREEMAAPLNARYGYSSPELQQTLERSIRLAESLGRKDSLLAGLVGLWSSRFVQGNIAGAHEVATRALTLVDPGSPLRGSAHFAFAGSAVELGRPEEALHHFDRAAALTRGAPSLTVGTRPDVHGSAWAAHAHWLLGHNDAALSCCNEAVRLAQTIDHPYSLAVALAYSGITHHLRTDPAALDAAVAELTDLCIRYGFAYYSEWALILGGWSRGGEAGLVQMRRGIDTLRSAGSFARMPYWLSLLADLSVREGEPGAARAALDAAIVAGQARDDLWWLPEVMRMRAAHDDHVAAIVRLRAAARTAAAHGSAALLRRCARDLAEHGVDLPLPGVPPAR
ncbi:BTAD domain-containing putative transcriptional regulator [Rhodococcus ruber]|uniref:SARP family transcriptional regulator fused with ATPase domain n=1 Tax=Rhodococcus ruber TaxID=1830 RepID=A0A098BGU8_9NOCA|nr:BTAD domain-containing putative transcriptional regulator [Rhodococcus ruber]MCD2128136.1 AAA family ATPase [Rhodococcus ruber]MCZ4503417.1 BTAD domain-containing putative transcriptional regulator [Rhodococcus ruber]MCZ4530313.1 BTAD domain-containing putative transcriptional regulator [Rhodococcus ruber]MCZ4621261.1 BTAD domain-containing putative transcriptional regulator [Rhodococcus ruber]MDI9967969.1 BTAD domain-containing putative transcriptional regulator [Rhodococcus ruber]